MIAFAVIIKLLVGIDNEIAQKHGILSERTVYRIMEKIGISHHPRRKN